MGRTTTARLSLLVMTITFAVSSVAVPHGRRRGRRSRPRTTAGTPTGRTPFAAGSFRPRGRSRTSAWVRGSRLTSSRSHACS
jgi:hypothetical protein